MDDMIRKLSSLGRPWRSVEKLPFLLWGVLVKGIEGV